MNPSAVTTLLSQDLENAQALEELLLEERTLLERRELSALNELLERKANVLVEIERNEESRRRQLQEAGFSADREGLQAWCEQEQAAQQLEQLRERLRSCNELTSINGAIVHRSRSSTRQVLEILRGRTLLPGLYDREGNTDAAHQGPNELGSA